MLIMEGCLPEMIARLQAAGMLPTTLAIPRSRAALNAAFTELVNQKFFYIKQLTASLVLSLMIFNSQ